VIVQILGNPPLSSVGRYGHLVMLESARPLPGEAVLIVSGALAHQGVLDDRPS
jgi:membrane protein DedA with SNARE-associated domain